MQQSINLNIPEQEKTRPHRKGKTVSKKKTNLNNLKTPHCYHREAEGSADVRECFCGTARDAIGEMKPGGQIFGFTKGQFSFMDLIIAMIAQIGPCEVDLSTWTAASADLESAYQFMSRGEIQRIRFVIDRSFATRQPEYCQTLRSRFGEDAIRVTRTHAKFVAMRNDDWNIVCFTSMNLNHNPRFEDFFIVDDPGICTYITKMVDEIYTSQEAGAMFEGATSSEDGQFKQLSILGEAKHPDITGDLPPMDFSM